MGLSQNSLGFHHLSWSGLRVPSHGNGGVFCTEGGDCVLQRGHEVEFAGFGRFWGGGVGIFLLGVRVRYELFVGGFKPMPVKRRELKEEKVEV